MAKREETLRLEAALRKKTREQRIYGCEEITIGFYRNGHGNEVVDFMTLDFKDVIRCYEIKVTLADFKSKAKKSWYGHYNYLVVSGELYRDHKEYILEHTPKHVGIIEGENLYSVRKSQRMEIAQEQYQMLLESMIRSMYWKMLKYYDASDLDAHKKLNAENRKLQKELSDCSDRTRKAERLISQYEKFKSYNEGLEDYDFELEVRKERLKWKENIKKKITPGT